MQQDEAELINDYNDRCIRKACSWYIEHAPKHKFVFLSDDAANRSKAMQENIPSVTVSEYVKHLKVNTGLTDKLSRKDFHGQDAAKDVFPNHLTSVELLTGIREGRLLQGTYRASRDNFLEGFVNVDSYEEPVRFMEKKSWRGNVAILDYSPGPGWTESSRRWGYSRGGITQRRGVGVSQRDRAGGRGCGRRERRRRGHERRRVEEGYKEEERGEAYREGCGNRSPEVAPVLRDSARGDRRGVSVVCSCR